ncbi:MAG: hypothetical protein ACOY91_23830 [Pseudomonadota bacterium]
MSEKPSIDDDPAGHIRPDAASLLSILGRWQPPIRKPGVREVETQLRTAEFLVAPYESKSGKPISSTSTDGVPLIMIEFPTFEQVQYSILEVLETRLETWPVSCCALRDDLRLAYIWLQVSLQYDSADKLSRRYDHLVKIKKAAHRLRGLLAIDRDEWLAMGIDWIIHPVDPSRIAPIEGEEPEERAIRYLEAKADALRNNPRFRYEELITILDHLVEETDRLASEASPQSPVNQVNPFENFLKGPLTEIYEKHLKMHEKPRRASSESRTTFALFVQAAFKMMHVEYDLGTVQRMMRAVNSERHRRRPMTKR